jgi:cardiolipin synthase A/B
MPMWFEQVVNALTSSHGVASVAWGVLIVEWTVRLILLVRIVLKQCPGPETLGWLILIGLLPFVGLFVYALVGHKRLGIRRVRKHTEIALNIDAQSGQRSSEFVQAWRLLGQREERDGATVPGLPQQLSLVAERMSGMPPTGGNIVELIDDAPALFDRVIADIDNAKDHVHMLYYIWGTSPRAVSVCDALVRAARRGVRCKVSVDAAGGKMFFRSELPDRLRAGGVEVIAGLPVSLFRRALARFDLRNHRKVTVIDGAIGYCGSQNLIDEKVKVSKLRKRYRYWLDCTCRVRGPAVMALQSTFLADWMTSEEFPVQEIGRYFPKPEVIGQSVVQVVPSGVAGTPEAIHQTLKGMLNIARRSVVLTTPYFVPDEPLKGAIVNAALRGVRVTLILPEQLDNRLVDAAARAHFRELLEAGVRIARHQGGLLHAKCAVVDEEIGMIGSANLDMRSFWINFECTLFVYDRAFCTQLLLLQERYIEESTYVDIEQWRNRTWTQRLGDHAAQLFAPLL